MSTCRFNLFWDRCTGSKRTGALISKKSKNARTRKKRAFWFLQWFHKRCFFQRLISFKKNTFLYLGHFDEEQSKTNTEILLNNIEFYWIYWNIEIFQYFWNIEIYWNIEIFQYYFNILKILKYWNNSIIHENIEILKYIELIQYYFNILKYPIISIFFWILQYWNTNSIIFQYFALYWIKTANSIFYFNILKYQNIELLFWYWIYWIYWNILK